MPRDSAIRPLVGTLKADLRQFHSATQLRNIPQSRAVRRVQSFDILMPRGPHAPRRAAPKTRPTVAPGPGPSVHAKQGIWRRLAEFAQYPLIAAVAIGSAYSSTVGQALVAVYLVVALLSRLSSRYSFGAALLLLVSVPAFQLLQQTGVAQNAAIYTYELLVVGTLQAVIEIWLESRRNRNAA